MFRRLLFSFISLLLFLLIGGATTAQAAYTETWGTSTGKVAEVTEFYRAEGNVGATSEGVGLSTNTGGVGSFSINNVPDDATILHAWLYWGGYIKNITAAQMATIVFNGTTLTTASTPASVLIATEDPEGNPPVRHTYRADVSSLIHSGGNGTYNLSSLHGANDLFGASLIIVYEDLDITTGTVVISDGQAMVSKKKSSSIANGDSVTVSIDNLTIANPDTTQFTFIVSEGTAVDVNEVTFSGKTSHNFGDFASNIDGKVWDNITIDANPYIDHTTTSVSATLNDVDDPGAYSHFFAAMFTSALQTAELGEATMLPSGTGKNPEDIVTFTVNIPNKGSDVTDDVRVVIPIPVAYGTYQANSTYYEGVLQSDSDDGDNTYWDFANKTLIINCDDIAVNDSHTFTFDVKLDDSLGHGSEVAIQGEIFERGTGQRWYTDGDGVPTDGIDRHSKTDIQGGRIINLPVGFTVYDKNSPSFDPSTSYSVSQRYVRLKKNGVNVAEIRMNLADDVDVSVLDSGADNAAEKAFFHGFTDLSVNSESYTLIVPRDDSTQLRLCVGANSLDQVGEGCATDYENVTEELVFSSGQTHGNVNCVIAWPDNNVSQWECSGVTGTGGQGEGGGGGGGDTIPEMGTLATVLAYLFGGYLLIRHRRRLGERH